MSRVDVVNGWRHPPPTGSDAVVNVKFRRYQLALKMTAGRRRWRRDRSLEMATAALPTVARIIDEHGLFANMPW